MILVKAVPTSETAASYFDKNKTTTVTNQLRMTAENWATGVSASQNVRVVSQLLSKSLLLQAAGELRWTVEYKPYGLTQTGILLQDTLPAGIELRTDATGAPLLTDDNITARELLLQADGSYLAGDAVALVVGENLFYDNDTRQLVFRIPDRAKAYRLSYVTDITGEPGTITNQVALFGGEAAQEVASRPYEVTAADGAATMLRSGWIAVTKLGADSEPLAGVEFTLLAADGVTVIRRGVTDSNGALRFKVLPDGVYILRETEALAGYTPHGRDYAVTVTTTGSTVVSSIAGQTGPDANVITIQNHPAGTAGNLTLAKTVAGNAADPTQVFDFTVTLIDSYGETDLDGSYTYFGDGVPNGTIQSGGVISLAGGQSVTIVGLPVDTVYAITEADYAEMGYVAESTGATGTIAADATQMASFTNTKEIAPTETEPEVKTGSLTIRKTVTGDGADADRKFAFTVLLVDAPDAYPFTGSYAGTVRSGETILLGDGESVTLTGLPAGARYTVTEADYAEAGYETSSTDASGVIVADGEQTAAYVNAWSDPATKGESDEDEPDEGGETAVPDTGERAQNSYTRLGLLMIGTALLAMTVVGWVKRRKYAR